MMVSGLTDQSATVHMGYGVAAMISIMVFPVWSLSSLVCVLFHLLPQKCPEIEESQFILCSGVLRNKNGSVSHVHTRNRLQNSTTKLMYKCIFN